MTWQNVSILACVACALVLSSPLAAAAGETIRDDAQGFTLTLPDGFVKAPELVGIAPQVSHAFVFDDQDSGERKYVLLIETMRGVIGREHLTLKDLPSGFQGRLFTTSWHEFEVDTFEIPEVSEGAKYITFNVQIPLKGRAIQVKLTGAAENKAELTALLTSVLAGLNGESNWLPSGGIVPAAANSKHYGSILLGFAISIILVGLIALWLVSRNTPRGTVLGIAAFIYFVSIGLDGSKRREILMIGGALRLLAIAGGLLGIIDYFRKRKPRDESTAQVSDLD